MAGRWDSPVFRASRFLLTNDDSWCVLPSVIRALLNLPHGRAAGSHPNDVHAFHHLYPVGDSKCTAETALGHPWVTAASGDTVHLMAHCRLPGVSSCLTEFNHTLAIPFQSICPDFPPSHSFL